MATEEDVRTIALSLPETTEEQWYGSPGYKVKGKGFLRLRHEAEGGLVVFVADVTEKDALLASDPDKFFTTPHYDGYPAVLVSLPAIDVGELRELITDSWALKAPTRLRADYADRLDSAATAENDGPVLELPNIGKPAERALALAGLTDLAQLTAVSEADLLKLHGVGAKAVERLRAALQADGLAFRDG